ncbi:hypothetical protein [Mycolicibacterium sphagni]|uniref:hypothetical protein n=1 Tax=Mycolicibacterium sphagni TaxID=1786 RepID=UPI0021F27C7A|nr:hypothetical protein [Mycolicibacterium sphagni]MCV7174910.1 hypothetical protein [Mycolicibacterium sphagni]
MTLGTRHFLTHERNNHLLLVTSLLYASHYRPGWTITAHPCPFSGHIWLLIDAQVIDSENHTDTTRIGVRAVVPDFEYPAQFYDWLAWRLERIERHESREFFWVNGKPWNSPHQTPEPAADYTVRRHRLTSGSYQNTPNWEVVRHNGFVVARADTWELAYRAAWRRVIADDLAKNDEFVNGKVPA